MRARIEISPVEAFLKSTVSFIHGFARNFGISDEKLDSIRAASQGALSLVLEANKEGRSEDPIAVELMESDGMLVVEITNRGVPILMEKIYGDPHPALWAPHPTERHPSGRVHRTLPYLKGEGVRRTGEGRGGDESKRKPYANLPRIVQAGLGSVSFENFGRKGQKVILHLRLDRQVQKLPPARSIPTASFDDKIAVVRTLKPGEEGALSQLFYHVYGYKYVDESVYYPEKIRTMMKEGTLISLVAALPSGSRPYGKIEGSQSRSSMRGRLIGHIGLIRRSGSPPVYEAAWGIVDPAAKSRGLFKKLFDATLEKMRRTPMRYCFFDFVTNHDHSQRLISRYGACEMALFVGCQSKTTQASLEKLGLGPDPKDMDRYSILFSIIPRTKHPFGKEIALPERLGEPLGYLLKPLGLSWTPAPRFDPLPPEGTYGTHCRPTQGSVIFDLMNPGRKALQSILDDWRNLLRNGYQYAAVEVPLHKPGMAQTQDILSSDGFFISGFVPYRLSDTLGFRFQAVAPAKLAFEHIRIHSGNGRRLLKLAQEDYKRSSKL